MKFPWEAPGILIRTEDQIITDYTDQIRLWVRAARDAGYVITIEQVPLQPLAMGNHTDKVTVRKARNS